MGRSADGVARAVRSRSAVLRALLVLAALCLIGRLWQLQVVRGPTFYSAALNESLHVVSVPAPRGQILDRNGLVLATDVPVFDAVLTWTQSPVSSSEAQLLSGILGMSVSAVDGVEARVRQSHPLTPLVLREGITPSQYTLLVEHRADLPGVEIVTRSVRRYPGISGDANPGPDLAATILGYVQDGRLSGDVVGADGVEKSFNGPVAVPGGGTVLGLQGVDGKAYVLVNAGGDPVGQVGLVAPVPGDSVVLTIDAKLQAVAQNALSSQMAALRTRSFGSDGGPFPQAWAGAAVVIDVRNGQILALASEPTFNPNVFAAATSALPGSAAQRAFSTQYEQWLSQPGSPLVDHAISDVAPPGSTFKPITAIAALEQGAVTADQHVACPPYIPLAPGYVLHNWVPVFGGNLDLTEAMARSCDTYFYSVGARAGIAAIDRVAKEFGLGQLTGQTALYGEDPGQVSGPAVQAASQGPWTTALTMQSAIGQGLNDFNPLEVADYVAALANGGTLWRPYFVSQIRAPDGRVLVQERPQVRSRIPVSSSIMQAVQQAMAAVTQMNPAWRADGIDADFGTAYWTYYGFSAETAQYLGQAIQVAGKTGTAQTVPGATSDGWFISFAPAQNPQIAVVVFIHHAGEGFASGGPVAREIYDYYFGLDRAMWRADQTKQIIPSEVSMYFGMSQQFPDWWPATPPAAPKTKTPASAAGAATSATAAGGGTGSPSSTHPAGAASSTTAAGAGGSSSASAAGAATSATAAGGGTGSSAASAPVGAASSTTAAGAGSPSSASATGAVTSATAAGGGTGTPSSASAAGAATSTVAAGGGTRSPSSTHPAGAATSATAAGAGGSSSASATGAASSAAAAGGGTGTPSSTHPVGAATSATAAGGGRGSSTASAPAAGTAAAGSAG